MDLNADKAGVKISDRGMVEVNDHLQTQFQISMQLAMLFVEQC
jgi:pyruvate/2-oxoglutarate dehydrogenase complex dihydrolipoamide dehydrogenase (E3) component